MKTQSLCSKLPLKQTFVDKEQLEEVNASLTAANLTIATVSLLEGFIKTENREQYIQEMFRATLQTGFGKCLVTHCSQLVVMDVCWILAPKGSLDL